MRSIVEVKKNYFICDGNTTTVYELLDADAENVNIRAVLNDNVPDVFDRYTITTKNFNNTRVKKLDGLTIKKLVTGKIKVYDLYEQYFGS